MIRPLDSASGMNIPGGTMRAVGLAPADQDLGAAQLARADIDDRLVVRHEFAGLSARSISAIGLSRFGRGSSTVNPINTMPTVTLARSPSRSRSPDGGPIALCRYRHLDDRSEFV